MNTKLNNWFIHPDYKEENGIYSQCADFKYYQCLFKFKNHFYDDKKIFGYYNDDLDIFLNHNENNNDGNEYGYFATSEEDTLISQSEYANGLFTNTDECLLVFDHNNDYYYDGSGDGDGNGYDDGFMI